VLLEIGSDYLLRTQSTAPDLRIPVSEIRSIQRLPETPPPRPRLLRPGTSLCLCVSCGEWLL